MQELSLFPSAFALIASLIAAITDCRQFRIYNVLTLPLLASGLIYHGSMGGLDEFAASGLGALTGLAFLLPLYLWGGMGAGDIKLIAGLGAWLKPTATCEVLLLSCLLAAGWTLALILRRRMPFPWFRGRRTTGLSPRLEELMARPDRRSRLVPFGLMVALGLGGLVLWHHGIQ